MDKANNNHKQVASQKESNSTPEAKLPFGKNTTFKHNTLGEVEIKYISVGDSEKITQFLQETELEIVKKVVQYYEKKVKQYVSQYIHPRCHLLPMHP